MVSKARVQKEKSKKTFDEKSVNYDETRDGKYCKKMYQDVMRKIAMQPFKTLLDVGCGTGTILSMVLQQHKDVHVSGIDLSEKMIKKAVALLGNLAELRVGDSEHLPWKDNSFDVVACNASFHHYPEPMKVLHEVRRVLKPEGRVIISDPWWPNPRRFLVNLFLKTPFNNEGDVRFYSEQESRKLLSLCGFKSIQWEVPGEGYSIICANASK